MKVTRGAPLALSAMVVALAGCGGSGSDGIDGARYVREANKICASTQAKAAAGGQPLSMFELKRRLQASHRALLTGARRLRTLRAELADAPSAEIKAFQRRVMPVVSMTTTLGEDAEFVKPEAVARHAEKLRRRSAALYRAAQAAGLEHCGRGGNRAADRALFVAYRVQYLDRNDEASLQTALAWSEIKGTRSRETYLRGLATYLGGLRTFRDDLRQLRPPRDLRRAHRALRGRLAKLLRGGEAIRAGFLALPAGRVALLRTIHAVGADETRADRSEQRMRRLLTPRRGRPHRATGATV